MSVSDSIGDALTVIRNGARARLPHVEVGYSNKMLGILKILKEEGYIENFKKIEVRGRKFHILKVVLKYATGNKSVIDNIRRISTPGLRAYTSVDEMPRVLNGLGIAVVSTSRGIMTDRKARSLNVGGEVICYVW